MVAVSRGAYGCGSLYQWEYSNIMDYCRVAVVVRDGKQQIAVSIGLGTL